MLPPPAAQLQLLAASCHHLRFHLGDCCFTAETMRFDVPLVSIALVGATSAAAWGPGGYGPGANVDHRPQFGGNGRPQELGQLEGEIERLEQELEKDLKEFEKLEASYHHRPAPYHPGAPASYAESSSAVTAAPAGTDFLPTSIPAPAISATQSGLTRALLRLAHSVCRLNQHTDNVISQATPLPPLLSLPPSPA